MHQIRKASRVGAATALALLLSITVLAGCGGGSSGSDAGGVASIDTSESSKTGDSSKSSSKDSEQELLDYTKCLRKQGLDVPDPTVDANGNLQLGGGGAPGGGAPTDGGQQIDRSAMEKAQEVCGDLPDSVTQQFDDVDQSAMQDTLLEYAKCMRKNGVDMPDPDFSNFGTPGPGQGGGQDGGQGGGPLGDVDRDDPDFEKASEACQSLLAGIGPGQSTTTEAN